MASIWKDSRSKNWVACFTDAHGRRLKKTTDTTDRKKAQKIADGYELVATRKQTIRTIRETITSLAKEIWGTDAPVVSVRAHVEAWVKEKSSGTAKSTSSFYEQSSTKFLEFLGQTAEQPIDGLERSHVAAFKTELTKTLSTKTVNHYLKCIRMMFKAARRDGLIEEDPAEFVDAIKKTVKSSRRPFTLDELKKVLAACNDEWKSMVICGLYTGQRLIDVACLQWQNVDLLDSEIRIVARKTNKKLRIPIAPPLQKHLESLPSSDDPTTPLHPKSHAIVIKNGKSGALSNQFAGVLVGAGLRDAKSLKKTATGKGHSGKRQQNELSYHSIRHTAVTMLKEAGIAPAVVMELIGHDSEQMSQHYTHVGKDALQKAADSMPDLGV